MLAQYNKKILWVQLSTVTTIIKGPLLLFFIGLFLDSESQGYWFTFTSLGALVFLADMGFTIIITQYVSNYCSDLDLKDMILVNNRTSEVKVFIYSSLKIYTLLVLGVSACLLVFGLWFFDDKHYSFPWLVYILSSVILLLATIMQSILLGFDQVVEINKHKTMSMLVVTIFTLLFLYNSLGIWSLAVGSLLGAIFAIVIHIVRYNEFWRSILSVNKSLVGIRNLESIGSLQLKFAISWICGYFIFQIYVPVLFKFNDIALAGQVGITIAAFTAINQFSNSFLQANVPQIGRLIGKGETDSSRTLFVTSAINRAKVYISLCFLLVVSIHVSSEFRLLPELVGKFVDIQVMIFISAIYFFSGIISNFATYIRCHREERFVFHAIVNALSVVLILFNFYHNINIMFASVLIVYAFVLTPYAYYLYQKRISLYDI